MIATNGKTTAAGAITVTIAAVAGDGPTPILTGSTTQTRDARIMSACGDNSGHGLDGNSDQGLPED